MPAAGLMVRRSSDILAVNHKGVASCLRLIQDRLHERLTLDDLATAGETSQRTLHKEFLKYLGCTPGQALRNARIEKAKRLLAEPARHKLGVVANACGYRSANSLCATFSKFVGTTPHSFRKTL
jgi:transcriptional regulator GlxA family with amidase domain